MGLFYIYSNKSSKELYDLITFSEPYYTYIEPDNW